jgi:Flp pilus assembly protein TadG
VVPGGSHAMMGRMQKVCSLQHMRSRLASSRGQALVEFALVVPLILALFLGVVDFGEAFNQQNDQSNMANQAIRYAEVNNCAACGASKIQTYIPTTADTTTLKNNATVCFSSTAGATPQAGDPITVKVSAPFTWDKYLHLGNQITISASVTGRLDAPYKGDGTDSYTLSASC